MNNLWDAIDISENLGKTLRIVRRMSGAQAAIMALFCSIMFIAAAMLAWSFDIKSTIDATAGLVNFLNLQIPYEVAQYSAWIVLGVTLAPMIFETGGAMFAREGSTPFQAAVIALSLFDLVTDAPLTTAFLSAHWRFFEQFGVFTYPVYWVAWCFWLFCSSFAFEMIAICLAVAVIGLLLKSFAGSRKQQQGV